MESITSFLVNFANSCAPKSFFGIPSWYKYFQVVRKDGICQVQIELFTDGKLDLSQLFLVGLGILDILLRLSALLAVGFVMYAGIQYVTAQGEPEKAKHALGTIITALIGLSIAIIAASFVSFIGNRIGTDV